MRVRIRAGVATALTLAALGQVAADPAHSSLSKDELRQRYPELAHSDIQDGPIPGLFEVTTGTDVLYVSADGELLFRGDIVKLDTKENLTLQRRERGRAELLATIDPAKAIVFAPPDGNVKHRVFVFTDVDCGYCRQFHREIARVNALGIEVEYLSYPRTGPNSESWATAQAVWCAADKHGALTEAKLGAAVAAVPNCSDAPIAEDYELGRRIGLTGTPGVYAENGVELGGYLSPEDLLAALEIAAEPADSPSAAR